MQSRGCYEIASVCWVLPCLLRYGSHEGGGAGDRQVAVAIDRLHDRAHPRIGVRRVDGEEDTVDFDKPVRVAVPVNVSTDNDSGTIDVITKRIGHGHSRDLHIDGGPVALLIVEKAAAVVVAIAVRSRVCVVADDVTWIANSHRVRAQRARKIDGCVVFIEEEAMIAT